MKKVLAISAFKFPLLNGYFTFLETQLYSCFLLSKRKKRNMKKVLKRYYLPQR